MLLKVMLNEIPRLLPRNKGETLFSPFLVSTVVKLFICFSVSHSCLLMADITLLLYTTGWAALDTFTNLVYDEDFKENNLPRFPYQEQNVDHWFQEQVPSDGHPKRTINMLNLLWRPKPNEYPHPDNAVFPPGEDDVKGFTMLYHGTRRHEHVQSILAGIRLSETKRNGDFSCGKGFYVTKDFENAARHAFVKTTQAAVLSFKIPNNVLEEFRGESLDLMGEDKKDEWERVTRDIQKESKKYNFIEGPEMKRECGGAKTYEQLPGTHQMCILDKEIAKAFDAHLHAVVCYNTSRH